MADLSRHPLVAWAAEHAGSLLAPLGGRWLHVQGVAARAIEVSAAFAVAERPWLVAAAYLHDIGYAPAAADTGLHQLDGARHLRAVGAEDRLCRLVAYHSCGIYEVEERGLAIVLVREFQREASAVADALVYCDMTTGGQGERVSLEDRLRGIFERYKPESVVARAIARAEPCFRAAVRATEARLASPTPSTGLCAGDLGPSPRSRHG